ncbi:MAG: CpaF family protein [Chloroflexi bacterium]|nr:CpaF family protein [Chloroflexota bacterium]
MNDPVVVARVRAAVSVGFDPSSLLAVYADRTRRALLRERVRIAAATPLDERAVDALCAELFGFGPIQELLEDPAVTDVLVNTPSEIFVERGGRLERSDVSFRDAAELADLVHRIAASVGRELTIEQPFVDARMRDGSRANVVIEPVGGPSLSIRTFRSRSLELYGGPGSWTSTGGIAESAARFLGDAVNERANIVVSGATGSGKSTLLRSLAAFIPPDERLIVIEDTHELALPHPHTVHLECVPGRDGSGVRVADLVVNALRMRPDRIIVGEVRAPREASALLEALSTGHDGSLTTLHAGSADDAIGRLELLLARAGELAPGAIARHVRRALDLIVHVRRDPSGQRSVREIVAVRDDRNEPLWRAGETAVRIPSSGLRWR